MTTPFDLAGGSLIAEEHKGDYAAALSLARQLAAEAETSGNSRTLARALLAQAMVEMLSGCPGGALVTLNQMFALRPEYDLLLKAWPYAFHANNRRGVGLIDPACAAWPNFETFLLWGEDPTYFSPDQGWQPGFRGWLQGDEHPGDSGEPGWEQPDFGVPDDSLTLSIQNARLLHAGSTIHLLPDSEETVVLRQADRTIVTHYLDGIAANLASDYHAARAVLYRARAEQARRWGKHRKSLSLLHKAVKHYSEVGDDAGLGSLSMLLGDWLVAPGSSPLLLGMLANSAPGALVRQLRADPSPTGVAEAKDHYSTALELFADHPRGKAALALRLAYLASLAGDHDEAASYAGTAEDVFDEFGDLHGSVVALMHAALYRIAGGGFPDDDLAERLGGWAEYAGSPSLVFNLGKLADAWGRYLLHDNGDVRGALRCHELAARVHRSIGVPTAESASYAAAQDAFNYVEDYQHAAEYGERALTALTPALQADHPLLSQALDAIPILLAAGLHQRYVSARDGDGLAAATHRLRPFRDRYVELLADIEPITRAELVRAFTAGAQLSMSELLGAARTWEPALDYLVEQADWFAPYLRAVSRTDRPAERTAELTHLLAQCRTCSTPAAREIEPFVLLALRRNDEAVAAFDRVTDGFGAPPMLLMFGLLRDTGESFGGEQSMMLFSQMTFYTKAGHYQQAAAMLRALERLDGPDWWQHTGTPAFDPLCWIARTAEGLGQWDDAAEWYRRAIDNVETHLSGATRDSWQTSFYGLSNATDCYAEASRCALRRDRLRESTSTLAIESLDLSERGRARATADLLASQNSTADPLIRAWRQADAQAVVRRNQLHRAKARSRADVAELARAADGADRHLAAVEHELAQRSPLLARPAAADDRQPLVVRVARTLPADTAMLVYRIHDDSLLIWAITDHGLVIAEERPLERHFAERVRLLFEACGELAIDWSEPASDLSHTILDPVAPVLHEHPRLLVVPSRALHRLPMHVLPWADEPLVASHEVRYLPAVQQTAERSSRERRLVAFGDPTRMRYADGTSAEALPEARHEAELIAARCDGTARLGDEVTREAVLAALATPGVVHLASHGEFDADAPLNSAVLLADGDRLTAAELMGAEVRAEVVVLGACSTAAGAVTNGEDVIGLPRALLVGGAGAVVATLWEAYDGPTAQLVAELHDRLHEGQPVAAALREAQNTMRCGAYGRVAQHPGCWASLIVIG